MHQDRSEHHCTSKAASHHRTPAIEEVNFFSISYHGHNILSSLLYVYLRFLRACISLYSALFTIECGKEKVRSDEKAMVNMRMCCNDDGEVSERKAFAGREC